ncbi:hypothetical protein AB0C74_39680 [Spirillospora sp. NPDC048832]
MFNIIPRGALSATIQDPEQLAWAISRMTPGLCVPGLLNGETLSEALARQVAAADILDDLMAEYAEEVAA